jgi:aerobic-type carbon monoxide dehydrogenase small subunit (CoxS/CutS family)
MALLSFELNGKTTRVTADESRPLLWVLRDDLGLTGTKFGCGEGHCGSCTPGMILGAYAFLLNNPRPTRDDIARQLRARETDPLS